MALGGPAHKLVQVFNGAVTALADSPRWGRLVSGQIATISYVGRRSGRRIELPIGYRRSGDEVTINVMMADQKAWWRNFLGAGAPLTIRLRGVEHPAHAVATRDDRGRVKVTAHLDKP